MTSFSLKNRFLYIFLHFLQVGEASGVLHNFIVEPFIPHEQVNKNKIKAIETLLGLGLYAFTLPFLIARIR